MQSSPTTKLIEKLPVALERLKEEFKNSLKAKRYVSRKITEVKTFPKETSLHDFYRTFLQTLNMNNLA